MLPYFSRFLWLHLVFHDQYLGGGGGGGGVRCKILAVCDNYYSVNMKHLECNSYFK